MNRVRDLGFGARLVGCTPTAAAELRLLGGTHVLFPTLAMRGLSGVPPCVAAETGGKTFRMRKQMEGDDQQRRHRRSGAER